MQTDFRLRERGAATVISLRTTARLATIGAVIGESFGEAYGLLGPAGVAEGEPFVVYHGMPGAGDHPFEIEICAPVRRPIDPPAGWTLVTLPAGTFASVVHVGPYAGLGTAYDELEAWIAREGFSISGPPREVYLSEPGTPAEVIRTIVEFPVSASTAAVPVVSG